MSDPYNSFDAWVIDASNHELNQHALPEGWFVFVPMVVNEDGDYDLNKAYALLTDDPPEWIQCIGVHHDGGIEATREFIEKYHAQIEPLQVTRH